MIDLLPQATRFSANRACGLALAALLACAALVAPPRPLHAQGYANPVLTSPAGVADPFILKWNGEYYLYATGDPIMAYHSRDLVHWDTIGGVLRSNPTPGAWNQGDVWAPEVLYRNGTFYLYYTASKVSRDWRVGEYARRVGVAVAESPRGPFVDSGRPVTPYWTIDGDVFRDPDGPHAGEEWLFASYLDEARWHGAGITADRLTAPDRVAGAPAKVTQGSEAWEDKDGDPNNGSLRYTNEAPTVFKRRGRYYMMYSGGSWDLPTYALAYAWSDSLPAGGLQGPGWHKVVPPILRSTPFVDAPGHNTLTLAPNNVADATAYHARVVPFVGPGDRQTFIDRVYWNGDRPYMDQPTTATLPPPDRPLFGDIFDRADGPLGESWVVRGGTWRVAGEAAHASADALALPRVDRRLTYLVMEANVRLPGPAGAGGAGIALVYVEPRTRLDIWLDRGRRSLVTGGEVRGRPLPEQATPLPADFRFDRWHQLLLTKNAGSLRVALDGVRVQERQDAAGIASVALATRGSAAAFDGVALTAHYEDDFDDGVQPTTSWLLIPQDWSVHDSALRQDAARPGLELALKGDGANDYEFSASVRLLEGDSASQVGIVAAHDPERLLLAGFDHTIWPFARFHVRYRWPDAKGMQTQALEVEMPRGFRYDEYHTIRVLKQGSAFTFWLDGAEIVAARFPFGQAEPGLFTEGARADFDDAAMTWISTPRNLVLDGSFEAERWQAAATAPELPWQLAGKAIVSFCCGHTGTHRLLLRGTADGATQVVRGLESGRYALEAWVSARGAEATLAAATGNAPAAQATGASEGWRRITLDFDVPPGQSTATIRLGGRFTAADGSVAFDDVYLARRP